MFTAICYDLQVRYGKYFRLVAIINVHLYQYLMCCILQFSDVTNVHTRHGVQVQKKLLWVSQCLKRGLLHVCIPYTFRMFSGSRFCFGMFC